MRKVNAWLVTRFVGWGDVILERPVIAFQSREMAERCMDTRNRRAYRKEDPTWHEINEIEVVMDDARD